MYVITVNFLASFDEHGIRVVDTIDLRGFRIASALISMARSEAAVR